VIAGSCVSCDAKIAPVTNSGSGRIAARGYQTLIGHRGVRAIRLADPLDYALHESFWPATRNEAGQPK